jgi:hypothetical protein
MKAGHGRRRTTAASGIDKKLRTSHPRSIARRSYPGAWGAEAASITRPIERVARRLRRS